MAKVLGGRSAGDVDAAGGGKAIGASRLQGNIIDDPRHGEELVQVGKSVETDLRVGFVRVFAVIINFSAILGE